MRTQSIAASLLGLASFGLMAGSLAWAWATFDFWETVPLVPCVGSAGALAALAIYSAWKRAGVALLVGVLVVVATFVGTLLITLARWEG